MKIAAASERLSHAAIRACEGSGRFQSQSFDDIFELVLKLCVSEVRERLPLDVSRWVGLSIKRFGRFKPSELMFAMLRDVSCTDVVFAVLLCSSVELANLARLIADDVIDNHSSRWESNTLWVALDSKAEAGLASSTLNALAVALAACGHARRGQSAATADVLAGLVAEREGRMAAAMLAESLHVENSISSEAFKKISAEKHCMGSLCAELVAASDFLDPAETESLIEAMRFSDLAAGIANDCSEVNGWRGEGQAPRKLSGEPRGLKTEIELRRPTIFQVYVETGEYVAGLHANSLQAVSSEVLWTLDGQDLVETLEKSGALHYAIAERDRLRVAAEGAVPGWMRRTRAWAGGTAVIHEGQ